MQPQFSVDEIKFVQIILEYEEPATSPCIPSPCGQNSLCRVSHDRAVCSCQPEYNGAPPNCRVECMVNSDCSRDKACQRYKCADPCQGACGHNAVCRVVNHSPICTCISGYTGDPFEQCLIESKRISQMRYTCNLKYFFSLLQ